MTCYRYTSQTSFYRLLLDPVQEARLVDALLFRREFNERMESRFDSCGESQVFSRGECAGYNLFDNNCGQVVMDSLADATSDGVGGSPWPLVAPMTAGFALQGSNYLLERGRINAGPIYPGAN